MIRTCVCFSIPQTSYTVLSLACLYPAANGHTEIVFRKSDVRKLGLTRGWELMLSHSFRTNITTGYAKGTPSSDMVESIKHLRACASQILHPLLLPVIIISHDLSQKNDQKQRQARDWLRTLESAVSMRTETLAEENKYIRGPMIDLDQINMDLVECHSRVLWKRPQAYQEIIRGIEKGMAAFWERAKGDEDGYGGERGEVYRLHRSMLARLDFYSAKLTGIENYAHITLERLAVQRQAVSFYSQSQSTLSLSLLSPSSYKPAEGRGEKS